jgi:isoleucyl-tRNA synthetase
MVYALVDTPRGLLVLAGQPGRKVPGALPADRHRAGHAPRARRWAGIELPPPAGPCRCGLRPRAPVYLADYATADDGTGLVHSSPAYGVDDFNSCVAHGMALRRHPQPGAGQRPATRRLPLFGGLNIWKACPQIIEVLRNADRLFATTTSATATRIAGATRRR